jgi:hypothetical protein
LDAIAARTAGYFPERFFTPEADQEPFYEIWSAKALLRIEEPSLYARRTESPVHSYRLYWARSFHPAITVRLDVETDGSSMVIARHQSILREQKVTTRIVKLSRWRTARLVREFESSGFWTAPVTSGGGGLDGSTWLWEGCRGGRYHAALRWTPENGDPLKSLGLTLLETAGFWRGPVY